MLLHTVIDSKLKQSMSVGEVTPYLFMFDYQDDDKNEIVNINAMKMLNPTTKDLQNSTLSINVEVVNFLKIKFNWHLGKVLTLQ
jgi:hypothetical protein